MVKKNFFFTIPYTLWLILGFITKKERKRKRDKNDPLC